MIFASPDVVRWVENELGETYENGAGVGLERGGKMIAGVVYCNHYKTGCYMHVASVSPYWFTKEFSRAVFAIPFIQWGYERVTALVYDDNEKSKHFLERIGFVHEGTMRGTRPVQIYGLLKTECRWHKWD